MEMVAEPVGKFLLPQNWKRKAREYLVSIKVKHLFGPPNIILAPNEAAVTCVLKNGEYYIQSFIRHYTEMGFRHIFLLDNGSTDHTISIARAYENVSVFQSLLPIDGNQCIFKAYLAKRCVMGGWCLDADIDEFLDYPFSEFVELRQLLNYLNKKKYRAVITQLLDMFPDKPLSELETRTREDALGATYRYYDIADITRTPYTHSDLTAWFGSANEVCHANAELYFGGIRKKLYGNNCLLTKHSLFFPGSGLELFPHAHFVNGARLADISCVMLHYKLTSSALGTALQNKQGFLGTSKGYDDFIRFLLREPKYQIRQRSSLEYRSAEELVQSHFLFVSEDYRDHARVVHFASNERTTRTQ